MPGVVMASRSLCFIRFRKNGPDDNGTSGPRTRNWSWVPFHCPAPFKILPQSRSRRNALPASILTLDPIDEDHAIIFQCQAGPQLEKLTFRTSEISPQPFEARSYAADFVVSRNSRS